MPALKWHEWVLTAWGIFHQEGLEINVTTTLISFSETLFCPIPPSCSLRTLWQCIDLWRKRLFLGTIRALQQEGGWEPWTACIHLPLGMLWQGSCLPWPNKNNWKPLCSSAQMQEWRVGIMGFLQSQFTWANPWHYSRVSLPWDKHVLLVRKGEISDCQDHALPITVQPEWNLT